jgi:uncharacterized protein HemX
MAVGLAMAVAVLVAVAIGLGLYIFILKRRHNFEPLNHEFEEDPIISKLF